MALRSLSRWISEDLVGVFGLPGGGICSVAINALVAYCNNLQNARQVSRADYGFALNFPLTFDSHVWRWLLCG